MSILDNIQAPILIPFGPSGFGKSEFIARMIYFWISRGHKINGCRFGTAPCPSSNKWRKLIFANTSRIRSCNGIGGTYAFEISSKEGVFCQILDIPGPICHDNKWSLKTMPQLPIFEKLCNLPNKRVWLLFLDENWTAVEEEQVRYLKGLCLVQDCIPAQDKVVFLFCKFDNSQSRGPYPNKKDEALIFSNYCRKHPELFERYRNKSLFTRVFKGKYSVVYDCFSSGLFCETADGEMNRHYSHDAYCEKLFQKLKPLLKNS